jgi:hypothetical protein
MASKIKSQRRKAHVSETLSKANEEPALVSGRSAAMHEYGDTERIIRRFEQASSQECAIETAKLDFH